MTLLSTEKEIDDTESQSESRKYIWEGKCLKNEANFLITTIMENHRNSLLYFSPQSFFFPLLLPFLSFKLTSLEINGINGAQSHPASALSLLLYPPQSYN